MTCCPLLNHAKALFLFAFACPASGGDALYQGRSASEWVADMHDGDLATRRKAVYALWHLGDPTSAVTLVEALESDDGYVRSTAAKALVKLGEGCSAGLPRIGAMLSHDREDVRREAATLCYRLGPLVAPIVDALKQALGSTDPVVRANAAAALGNAGQAASSALPLVEALLDDEDKDAREWAGFALARMDPMRALRSTRTLARVAALRVLGDSPVLPPAGIEILLDLISDKDEDVRIGAANVLGSALLWRDKCFPRGTERAEKVLVDGYKHEESVAVRTQIVYAFGRLPVVADTTVPWLIEDIGASDPTLRTSALNALRELGPKARPAVPAVLEALHHPDRDTRSGAAFVLGYLATGMPEAVAALVQALQDPEPRVVMHAAGALGMLGDVSAVPPLIQLVKEGSEHCREQAALALGDIGPGARDAVPVLHERLADDQVARAAAYALVAIEEESPDAAREVLLAALLGDDEMRRNVTNSLLRRLKTRAVVLVPSLVTVIERGEPRRRERAALALASVGPAAGKALPALRNVRDDPDPEVRKAVQEAIQRIEGK